MDRSFDALPGAGPGFSFAESLVGTNGIGPALVRRRPCHVVGAERFAECFQRSVCVRAAVEVPLPPGRTATLVCRPVETHSGVTGFAVEVVLPDGPSPSP